MKKLKIITFLYIIILLPVISFSQTDLTQTEQREILDSLYSKLDGFYIKPELTPNIKTFFDRKYKQGDYKEIVNRDEFASKLTEDIVSISKDLHFYIAYEPDWVKDKINSEKESEKEVLRNKDIANAKKENFGFQELRILEGNIGYLDFRTFHDPAYASKTATSVMQFFSNTDALIIDMRNNSGGVLEMAQFISSYLFAQKESPLYKYYYYDKAKIKTEREMWLLPSVPGERLDKIDIYILTSGATFSSAEWMSYSLQNLKRVTIIGEQTAGGAHPVDRKILANSFTINIPFGEIIDPNTNTDFEGVGVTPDIKVSSNKALVKAHYVALKKLSKNNTDSSFNYNWLLPIVKNRENPINIEKSKLKSLVGNFGKGSLVFKDNNLYYVWNGKISFLLTPITNDTFVLDGILDFRIKIITKKGLVIGIKRVYENGIERYYAKEK